MYNSKNKASNPGDGAGLDELVCMDDDVQVQAEEILVPLPQWIEREGKNLDKTHSSYAQLQDASMLRKTTVAFAICKSIQHISHSVTIPSDKLGELCSVNNFVVRLSEDESDPGWKVKGIETVSPILVLKLKTDEVLDGAFFDEKAGILMGKNVSASMTVHSSQGYSFKNMLSSDANLDKIICTRVGKLLVKVFVGSDGAAEKEDACESQDQDFTQEPPSKRKSFTALSIVESTKPSSPAEISASDNASEGVTSSNGSNGHSLDDCGCPYTIVQIIKNLLDANSGVFSSDSSYQNLGPAINDLHLILKTPDRFLFDQYTLQTLDLSKVKFYGRSEELASLKSVFSRVQSSSNSEACFISGYSGCGKSRLVEECYSSIEAANGCVATKKFDEASTLSPLTRTLSAFNDLCSVVNARLSPDDALNLYNKFTKDLGEEAFKTLTHVLPNVKCFDSTTDGSATPIDDQVSDGLNYHSLCFTVQQFVRVLSTASIPLVLVLDDVQWADPISLGVIHTVFSDRQSCLMFVGCYRENEVSNDHIVCGLQKMLLKFEVPITNIHLEGLKTKDVQSLISDALSILPRFCQRLSDVICRKTDGNPFFVETFLSLMVDRGAIQYSLREKRWTYDIDAILAEEISENVLDLILAKISTLPSDCQVALEVASCFGAQVDVRIIRALSANPDYPQLQASMTALVQKRFIDFDGSTYKFVHDKCREAAAGLISIDDRRHYHFRIGVLLQRTFGRRLLADNESELLFTVIEQLNHGLPDLVNSVSHQMSIAELNCKAGWKRILECNFLSSHDYMKTAVSLLPNGSWSSHYDLSLKCYFYLAKAAYPCGYIDESKEILTDVVTKAKSPGHKMDAYMLLVAIQATNDPLKAFQTCIEVLGSLGQKVAENDINQAEAMALFQRVKEKFQAIPEGGSFQMEEQENQGKERVVMSFFTQLASLAFRIKPALCIAYISKYTSYTFDHKINSKYTPNAIVHFASILCSSLGPDTQLGCKIGKIGISIMKQHFPTSDEAPATILGYFGQVGVLNERIQECEFMHSRGKEIALANGNLYMASLNLVAQISRALQGGTNLVVLKEEIEMQLRLTQNAEHEISDHLKNTGNLSIVTPALLIFKPLVDSFIHGTLMSNDSQSQSGVMMLDILHQGKLMLCTFLGDLEEAHQHASKIQTRSLLGILLRAFYSSIASVGMYRDNGSEDLLKDANSCLQKLEHAAKCSEWNFSCKALLVAAELASVSGDNEEAQSKYDAAVSAAHSSKFCHEEALACELAAMHYKRTQRPSEALDFFEQAKGCYTKWGSDVKVSQMNGEIENLCAGGLSDDTVEG